MLARVSRDPRRALLLLPLAAALAAAAGIFAADAAGEMPANRDAPTISGALVVGATLTGHNGSWLYGDGSSCRSECEYLFAWQRCVPGGVCASIPGATARTYVVSPADARHSLRVVVTARKYDCNALNQDCRHVLRSAPSSLTAIVPTPPPPPVRLTFDRFSAGPAPRGAVLVSLRVTDGLGRAQRGTVVTGRSGAATFRLVRRGRARSGWISVRIRAEQPGRPNVLATSLLVRLRLGAAR
jgi:hypothetical protein